jgi:hypothetical protein
MLVSFKLEDKNQGSSVGWLKKNPNPTNKKLTNIYLGFQLRF